MEVVSKPQLLPTREAGKETSLHDAVKKDSGPDRRHEIVNKNSAPLLKISWLLL